MTLSDSGAAEAAPADDLRESLAAAFDEASEAPETPEARDPETGRFAATDKAEDAPAEAAPAEEKTDQPAEAKPEEAATPPIPAPVSWSAAEKASWDKLPREAQEAIQRRESDVARGFQQKADEVKAFEPLRQVLAPHADRLTKTGRSPVEVIGQLLDVHAGLEVSPYEVFPVIARMYGVDLTRLVPGAGAASGQMDENGNPVIAHLQQTVQQLQDRLRNTEQFQTQQQRAESEAQQQRAADEYGTFVSKAATDYPYLEEVRQDMATLIMQGAASTLEKAYKMATRSRDDIYERIQADQRKADEAKRAEEQRKAVAAAKARGTSVRTNPSTAPQASAEAGSLRAELERAFEG